MSKPTLNHHNGHIDNYNLNNNQLRINILKNTHTKEINNKMRNIVPRPCNG